ncbi:hypothetical protein INP59_21660 [Rhodococcus pyridinivorans]|uniref:MHYT domain-containing protein n=2 Tax=Rhodococcus pyridinivorans TaxID=103816 RepID=A0A7M2XU32_9NOCA|nr:hypothetical protein INP59_21660 [Rhodococcus pyridinivorans]
MHHLDLGLWALFLAYGTSIAGSFVGLSCARRAATTPLGPTCWRWLVMAALSISGVGIRMTHFIAMMGFAVSLMPYCGMAGFHASLDSTATTPEGATLLDSMLQAYILGTTILAAPLVALVLARQSADTEVDEAIATWSAEINDAVPYPGDRGQEATAELDTRRDVPRRPADPLRKGDVQVVPHERVRQPPLW